MAGIINSVLNIFTLVIFARVILSFILPLAGARPNPILLSAYQMINQVTEPVLGPLRRVLPTFGSFDFSPMVALVVIWVIRAEVVSRL
ncbi:MAG: YggT family protein [Dehalococcoidia bacterium]|nr:YggT family protein [Dehalococcoidia bacterium]MDP6226588.1 YggT family protein [Dehalococcoidia bacterium]MDP7083594.1 YggT family protein [Dehalococcoidia bacterium]MDP7199589.1 YggT family protein [Dehalococcoidia bacterium]MDP7511622.1 YggT family protein [Dehalococcoidia bacterium]